MKYITSILIMWLYLIITLPIINNNFTELNEAIYMLTSYFVFYKVVCFVNWNFKKQKI